MSRCIRCSKALFKYSNLIDVDGLISEEQANQIDQAQQQQQEAAIQAQQQKQASEAHWQGRRPMRSGRR